ncbi:MAG: hypothetical protein E4H28_08090 [Gemmatimonadales bacterium]|nr:MAG: hypothetical protein E4H28_08090 [Gemmatimonadales bacterium]
MTCFHTSYQALLTEERTVAVTVRVPKEILAELKAGAAGTMHGCRTNAAAVAYAVDHTLQCLRGNGKPAIES